MSAVAMLVVLGLTLGLVIGIVVKFYGVEIDPRIEAVGDLLPNANCGACGFAGCADFARLLVGGETTPEACPSNSAENTEAICAMLGLAAGARDPKVAVVLCGGDHAKATEGGLYNGVSDCRNAMLVAGGAKGCLHGCLGLGTCAHACPFGAMEMTGDGLAVVHPDICTGCAKCLSACPRGLIQLVPEASPVHVFCNSPAKGAAKRSVCKASCIACRKCVKAAGDGQIAMEGFLARINYDDPPGTEIAEECPTKCLQPSLPQLASAVAATSSDQEVVNG